MLKWQMQIGTFWQLLRLLVQEIVKIMWKIIIRVKQIDYVVVKTDQVAKKQKKKQAVAGL